MTDASVQPAGVAPAASCAAHEDRAADAGTCSRCGSFMCAECRQDLEPPLCRSCLDRIDESRAVAHVPVFAIVLMVHGALVLAMGLMLVVYGASLLWSFGTMPEAEQMPPGPLSMMPGMLIGTMIAEAALHLLVGGLQFWAGWRVRTYRSRGFGIAAGVLGLLTVLGCYCLPTSLAMLVWSLVVLLRDDVAQRFAYKPISGK